MGAGLEVRLVLLAGPDRRGTGRSARCRRSAGQTEPASTMQREQDDRCTATRLEQPSSPADEQRHRRADEDGGDRRDRGAEDDTRRRPRPPRSSRASASGRPGRSRGRRRRPRAWHLRRPRSRGCRGTRPPLQGRRPSNSLTRPRNWSEPQMRGCRGEQDERRRRPRTASARVRTSTAPARASRAYSTNVGSARRGCAANG